MKSGSLLGEPPRPLKETMMEAEFNHLNHATWECKYLGATEGVRIEEGHLMPDHVHMLISIPPKYSVAQIIVIHEREEFDMDRGRMSNAR
jgi:REP element-mobilizing transposase RayT